MDRCRACRSTELIRFLELGAHPVANRFVPLADADAPEPSFPLDAYVCLACALIQIPDVVPPDFFDHYLYTPAGATGLVRHFHELADFLASPGVVPSSGLVVDIGCNEGVLLEACVARGLRVLGVDPAQNLIERARAKGIEVEGTHFGRRTGESLRVRHGAADAITCTNTFNHIDDLHDFVAGVRALMSPSGFFLVEVPHSGDLVAKNEFDTIYHEHLSEFSVRSFVELYRAEDLEIFRVEALAVHGGSMQIFAQHRGGPRSVEPSVAAWLTRERADGLFDSATYDGFRARVEANRDALCTLIERLHASGKTIAAYGAPAKGNTLLIYCGLGPDRIAFVADKNPLKHQHLTPGMHVPVVPVDEVLARQPDYLLVLAWNYLDEIVEQQAEWTRRGGRFIVPIPVPRILD